MLRSLIRAWFLASAYVRHPFSNTVILETEDGQYFTGSGNTFEQALDKVVQLYEMAGAEGKAR